MANNVLKITFNQEGLEGLGISTSLTGPAGPNSVTGTRREEFQYNPRINGGRIQIYDPNSNVNSPYTNIIGEYTANLFANFFQLDYGLNGFLLVSVVSNVVTIVCPDDYEWTSVSNNVGNGPINVTFQISTLVNDFESISEELLINELESCSKWDYSVQMNKLINKVYRNGIVIEENFNNDTYSGSELRGQPITIAFEDYLGNYFAAFENLGIGASILSSEYISINITPSQNGATVFLAYNPPFNPFFSPIQSEWSLDGENWQTEQILTNQPDGDYTVYMRDQFGCSISTNYTIQGNSSRTPNHFISEANSINYVLQEIVDNCSSFRNQDNSFNFQGLNKYNYCENILFNLCDKVRTQLKTNYRDIKVTLRKDQFSPGTPGTPEILGNSNLLLWSEQLNNDSWVKNLVNIDVDSDGIADEIMANNTSGLHNVTQLVDKETESSTYTLSTYVKPDEYSRVYLRLANENLNGGVAGWINLLNGTWTEQVIFGSWSYVSSSISNIDVDGYYRVSLTVISDNTNKIESCIGLVNNNDEFGFIGDNTGVEYISGIYFKQTQLHKGNLTDYLLTTDSQVILPNTPEVPGTPSSEMTEYDIPVLQQSTNINRFQSLDGIVYNYGNNLTGIYFEAGNTYDENGIENGEYTLNGNRPDFAKVGNIITISNIGTFIIRQTLYDQNIQKNVLIIQNNFVSLPQQEIISCNFNLLDFEVYEFDIDFSNYTEGLYDVVIELTDDSFEDVCYISENILIKQNHENTICVVYYNENNRDIFYKYGIKNIIRIPLLDVDYGVEDESITNINDFKSELIKSSTVKKDRYKIDALPPNIRFKTILAFGSEFLFINNISYKKQNNVNLEHVENTNLAYIEQDFIKDNDSYTINNQNQVPLDDSSMFDLPVLINDSINLIKK